MKIILLISIIFLAGVYNSSAQSKDDIEKLRALTEKVADGNNAFKEKRFQDALRLYEDASRMDSTSFIVNFNRADALYELKRYKEAEQILDSLASSPEVESIKADYHYNLASCAMAQKNYSKAVENFKQTLLEKPQDEAARQSYAYSKKKLEDQQNQDQNQNQDQDKDQNKDQNQDKNQNQDQDQQNQDQKNSDQNKDQNKNQQDQNQNQNQQNPQGQQGNQPQLSEQAAQQMLQAIQAKEKQTQEKVKKEKAAALAQKKKQKTKNW